jgi:hypothetical protein
MKTLLEFMNRERLKKYKAGPKELDSDLLIEICRDKKSIEYISKKVPIAWGGVSPYSAAFEFIENKIGDLIKINKKNKNFSFQRVFVYWLDGSFPDSFKLYLDFNNSVFIHYRTACDIKNAILDLLKEKLNTDFLF